MTSSFSSPAYLSKEPALLKFSVYHPTIDASNFQFIMNDVLTPVRELLCENNFHLISARVNGVDKCPLSSKKKSDVEFDFKASFFGDPDMTVLMEAPLSVEDVSHDGNGVSFMSWTMSFHVVQLGQHLLDMAQIGGAIVDVDEEDAAISSITNDVLKLALQVSIMEGTLDKRISEGAPGAHISIDGDEVTTWSKYGFLENAPEDTILISPPTHEDLSSHMMNDHHEGDDSTMLITQGGSMSIVAAAMYQSHQLRNVGFGIFGTTVLLMAGLLMLAQRRRRYRRQLYDDAQKQRTVSLQLATEDDVSVMLKAGRQTPGNTTPVYAPPTTRSMT